MTPAAPLDPPVPSSPLASIDAHLGQPPLLVTPPRSPAAAVALALEAENSHHQFATSGGTLSNNTTGTGGGGGVGVRPAFSKTSALFTAASRGNLSSVRLVLEHG